MDPKADPAMVEQLRKAFAPELEKVKRALERDVFQEWPWTALEHKTTGVKPGELVTLYGRPRLLSLSKVNPLWRWTTLALLPPKRMRFGHTSLSSGVLPL